MNRKFTNIIRYFMDEWIPPAIRDSRWFMYPFFWYAYRGKNIEAAMDFKSRVYTMSPEEYSHFYNNLDTISRNRETDLSPGCIDEILRLTSSNTPSAADIGCGHGYLLRRMHQANPEMKLTGVDILEKIPAEGFDYVSAPIETLPFPDNHFHTLSCCHVIEHILHPEAAIRELERVTAERLIVVVPCQRYYYYTLDEHVNFFLYAAKLKSLFHFKKVECRKIDGDWFVTAYKN